MYNQKSLAVSPPSLPASTNNTHPSLLKEMNTPSFQMRLNVLADELFTIFSLTDASNFNSSLSNTPSFE